MGEESFGRLYLCDFKVDERIIDLQDKWVDYYKETSQCSNQFAASLRRDLKRWCKLHYTTSEIRAAKIYAESRSDL